MTIQQVLESYGDSRANEAQRTAVQNYEQKHGLKDGKPIEDDKGDGKGGNNDDIPAWAKALIESTNAVKTRLDAMDGNRITETRSFNCADLRGDQCHGPNLGFYSAKTRYTGNLEKFKGKNVELQFTVKSSGELEFYFIKFL